MPSIVPLLLQLTAILLAAIPTVTASPDSPLAALSDMHVDLFSASNCAGPIYQDIIYHLLSGNFQQTLSRGPNHLPPLSAQIALPWGQAEAKVAFMVTPDCDVLNAACAVNASHRLGVQCYTPPTGQFWQAIAVAVPPGPPPPVATITSVKVVHPRGWATDAPAL
ncbi:hypothetical protein MMC21_008052 [Puttea exsequens]|nr:hypothetical protein [Puttea exsequens]